MMHGESLYAWCGAELILVDPRPSYNMYYLSDDAFFFMTTESIENNGKKVMHSNIYMVESQFGNFTTSFIYKDKNMNAEVLNFGVDNTKKRLIILTGIKNQKNRRDKFVSIYDIDTE